MLIIIMPLLCVTIIFLWQVNDPDNFLIMVVAILKA